MDSPTNQKHPGILPLINADSGCDYHRLTLPFKYMGIDLDFFEGKQIDDVVKDAKIVIFNRTPHCPVENVIKMRQELGIKIVVDIDDYWVLNPNHLLSVSWRTQKKAEQIIESLKLADVVTCTTSLLADKVKQYNKNVHVIPNGLPFGFDQFKPDLNKTPFDGTRFIYAGGVTHFWDIQELSIPFSKVNNNPRFSKAHFNLVGFDKNRKSSEREWTKIENSFNLKGKLKNYTRGYNLPLDQYMNHYDNADVSLVPLEYNNFNRFKSNLKMIEAGCKNIPVICSNVEPYINEPINGKNVGIRYAKNSREWYDWIWYYTMNPNRAKEDGLALGEYVRKHYNLFKINEYRQQLFDHLIS